MTFQPLINPSDSIPDIQREAYKIGTKPVTENIVQSVIAKDLNDIEPRLIRYGYNVRNLSEMLNVKPSIIRSFLKGKLSAGQGQELQREMLAVGIPISEFDGSVFL
jgi:hypothetical protein